jgi:hypothetical protein
LPDSRLVPEVCHVSDDVVIRRGVVLAVVAVLLFAWVFLYRFNTLGGALGGFDNDHFLYMTIAKQVQAGEQPLRDFMDGVHGARPSLTYEFSAAAQRLLGNNLRSEAWLTVGGVALGATATFLAASLIAPWPWALSTAVVSALLSPKLYGYPKVVVTAFAVLLIISYARRPIWALLVAMSIWTAAAFLFRHDYSVYCALGFGAVIVLAGDTPWHRRITRGVVYGLLTALLLAPSLWWIQRYRGIGEYVRNSLEMSRNEYERTQIGWPVITPDGLSPFAIFGTDENAEAWIYYMFAGVPLAVLVLSAWKVRKPPTNPDAVALIAVSLMTAALWYSFLRGNLSARFGDMAPPVAVLGAFLLFRSTSGWPSRRAMFTTALAVAGFVLTVLCASRTGSVVSELWTSRLLEPRDTLARMSHISTELAAMPQSLREAQAADRMQAADYLHRCTRPTDRALVVGYYTDVLAFAERLFAGGRAAFVVGFYADDRYMRETIARLESQSVPIVLGGAEVDYQEFHLLGDYLHARYDHVGEVSSSEGPLRVFVRRGRVGTPSGPNGLPCFG